MEIKNAPKFSCEELNLRYGPIIGGRKLVLVLGYDSTSAFRQALKRGQLPVIVFELPGRRGKFAFTNDICEWLMRVRLKMDT